MAATTSSKETVLVIGATGNIGVSAVIGALRSGRNVLAIVRSQASAEKLFNAIGSRENVTTTEASIVSEGGIQSVVDRVRKGELPAFHHVYVAAGGGYPDTPLSTATLTELRDEMNRNFEACFLAYTATVPYLLAQAHPTSTWTICTGAQGDLGLRVIPAITQGAIFSMLHGAGHELSNTNIRLVEVYLAARVEIDEDADAHGVMRASDFATSYENVLARPEIRNARLYVHEAKDLEEVRWKPRGQIVDVGAWERRGVKDVAGVLALYQ